MSAPEDDIAALHRTLLAMIDERMDEDSRSAKRGRELQALAEMCERLEVLMLEEEDKR